MPPQRKANRARPRVPFTRGLIIAAMLAGCAPLVGLRPPPDPTMVALAGELLVLTDARELIERAIQYESEHGFGSLFPCDTDDWHHLPIEQAIATMAAAAKRESDRLPAQGRSVAHKRGFGWSEDPHTSYSICKDLRSHDRNDVFRGILSDGRAHCVHAWSETLKLAGFSGCPRDDLRMILSGYASGCPERGAIDHGCFGLAMMTFREDIYAQESCDPAQWRLSWYPHGGGTPDAIQAHVLRTVVRTRRRPSP